MYKFGIQSLIYSEYSCITQRSNASNATCAPIWSCANGAGGACTCSCVRCSTCSTRATSCTASASRSRSCRRASRKSRGSATSIAVRRSSSSRRHAAEFLLIGAQSLFQNFEFQIYLLLSTLDRFGVSISNSRLSARVPLALRRCWTPRPLHVCISRSSSMSNWYHI